MEEQFAQHEPLYPPVYDQSQASPVLGAFARYWYLILLPALLLCAAAVAIGLEREPTYTAETRLNVGGFNISSQSLPGYYGGATTLAIAYSRAAYSDRVIGPVADEVGHTEREVAEMMTSSPVKDSPIIRVKAESKNPREAITVANLTAQRLQRYAITLARSNPDAPRLLADYRNAVRKYRAALIRQRQAHRRRRGEEAADTKREIAELRKVTISGLYRAAIGGQATTNAVQLLNPARDAKSDRRAVMERLLAGAILGGLTIGLALAYMMGRRRLPSRLAR